MAMNVPQGQDTGNLLALLAAILIILAVIGVAVGGVK
jgi:hypothetical protein